VRLRALGVQSAIERFDKGEADIVLGGRIEHFPRLDVAGLSRGAIRLDPVLGLFGLSVTHGDGFLSSAANREAIAMAIDRNALIAAFSVGGWTASTRIVAPGVEDDSGRNGERWTDLSSAERQGVAKTRVTRWRADGRALSPLRIALPAGPGADVLFARLSTDLGAIGLQIRRVDEGTPADLRLVDQVARYPRTSWFLNQLSCAQSRALCHSPADTRAGQARSAADTASRRALLDEAEAELTAANVFIPFGSPIRWSLVSGDATGFATNRWGVHPLMPLAILPK